MRAHLVQLDISWEDKPGNLERVRSLVEQANPDRGELVVLPEMFDTGFSFHVKQTADSDGSTRRFLSDLASRRSIYVHGSRTALDASGRAMNLASVFGPDGELACEYEKVHPFSLGPPGERESDFFPGGREVKVYEWGDSADQGLRVCPTICFDLRFPELFRQGLQMGAELFVVTANWPSARARHLRALLIARAIENQAFVLGVNRVGADPRVAYQGESVAIDPKGEIIAELGDREGVLSIDLDPSLVHGWRARFPAWRDHRLLTR